MTDIFAQVRRFEAVGFTREQSECLVEVLNDLKVPTTTGLQPARKEEEASRAEPANLKADLIKALCIQGAAVVISIAVLIRLLP
jgi:hypothetical protein